MEEEDGLIGSMTSPPMSPSPYTERGTSFERRLCTTLFFKNPPLIPLYESGRLEYTLTLPSPIEGEE
jgi:hypothetical protein